MVLKDSLTKKSNLFITAFSFSNLDKIVAQEKMLKIGFCFPFCLYKERSSVFHGKVHLHNTAVLALSLPMSLALDVQTRDV